MARETKDLANATAASSDYPSGRITDESSQGAGDGTPVNQKAVSDIFETFMKIARDAGITFNNLPDNVTNGYQLLEAFNLLTGSISSYDVVSLSFVDEIDLTGDVTNPVDMKLNNDGSKLFISDFSTGFVREFDLSTAYDISTASLSYSLDVSAKETQEGCIAFNNDGSKFYVGGPISNSIHEYDLSTEFDLSTATFSYTLYDASETTTPFGLSFNNDGSKLFILANGNSQVSEFDLSTEYDLSTAVASTPFDTTSEGLTIRGLQFNSDGTKMYIGKSNKIMEYDLSTPFSVSTASKNLEGGIKSIVTSLQGFCFGKNGQKLYCRGTSLTDIAELDVTKSIQKEVIKCSKSFQLTGPVPSSASDEGTQGQVAVDDSYIYVCTDTNTWKRVAIATW